MKNLKLTLIALVLLVSFQSFAQNITLIGGVNFANLTAKDDDGSYDKDFTSNLGFHAGAMAEFSLGGSLFLESGLLLSTRGFKVDLENEFNKVKGKMNLLYLNVPVNAVYKIDLNDKIKLYGSVGPYLGIGIDGETDYEIEDFEENIKYSQKEDIKWGDDKNEDHLRRFDMGLNFGAGLEFSKFKIGATYGLGLYNIASDREYDNVQKNKAFQISFGFKLGK